MGEDEQESRHKLFRRFRCHHSRTFDRTEGNRDIFSRSLDTSDPLFAAERLTATAKPNRKSLQIIQDLLEAPSPNFQSFPGPRELFPDEVDLEDQLFEYFDYQLQVSSEFRIDDTLMLPPPLPEMGIQVKDNFDLASL